MARKKVRRAARKTSKKPAKKVRKIRKVSRKAPTRKVKKVAKRPTGKPPAKVKEKVLVGTVTHYYTNIGVSVIDLVHPVKIGDAISIEGATTRFQQRIDSMQIDRKEVSEARPGASIGLKVKDRVRENDKVYLVQ